MGGNNRTRSFIVILFILTLGFTLTSAGILNGNMAIGMDAYATKSGLQPLSQIVVFQLSGYFLLV
jgi:hypothetical protein